MSCKYTENKDTADSGMQTVWTKESMKPDESAERSVYLEGLRNDK
jgi:hypothetical protein